MTATVTDDRQLKVVPIERAVADYLIHCRDVRQLAPNTVASRERVLRRLMEVCDAGTATIDLNSKHIGYALAAARRGETSNQWAQRRARNPQAKQRKGAKESSLNLDRSVYRGFFAYLKAKRCYSPYDDPCDDVRNVKRRVVESQRNERRWHVPFHLRAALLEEAGFRHPRDRFVCAMGLYGGRRWDDMISMKIGDIDLDNETFTFTNGKTGGTRVTLPYSLWPEFGAEIRRWVAWLAGCYGDLNPEWWLIGKRFSTDTYRAGSALRNMHPKWPVDPTRPAGYQSVKDDVKLALEMVGAPVEELAMGIHALRHGCSRWLMDEQGWSLEDVATWMDHQNLSTTKSVYLAGTADVKRLKDKYGF